MSSVHQVFHVSLLKKYITDPESILLSEGLGVKDNNSYDGILVQILDRQVRNLSNKEVVYVQVQWKNHLVEGAKWEVEADIEYP